MLSKRMFLLERRKKLGLTQKQVADAAKISRTAYTNVELGTANPSVKLAKSIAKVLNIEWMAFFADPEQ